MRHQRLLTTAVAGSLLAATALPAAAAPDGPQRLRGMEGRSFAVDVDIYIGDPKDEDLLMSFSNCYTFTADGDWIDPALPAPGSWHQGRVGASTTYTATFGPIEQRGLVSPAGGRGTLQLDAVTTIPAGVLAPPALTAISTGAEVASCE